MHIFMQIKKLVLSKFKQIYTQRKSQGQDSQDGPTEKNTIMASFIIKHKLEHQKCFVVTCASGTKSLPIDLVIQRPKELLRDMHAEILAQRSFRLFLKNWLYKKFSTQSHKYLPQDIFVEDKKRNKLSFNSNDYELIFYTSEIPCGDCIVNQQHKNVSGSKPLSKLTADSYSNQEIFTKCILRTKPGRLDLPKNKRSWSLSCSDKIMTWTILGVQGKILSNFFNPIYLDKILIDSKSQIDAKTVINGLNLKYRVSNILHKSYSNIQKKLFYYVTTEKKIKRFTYQFYEKNPQVYFFLNDDEKTIAFNEIALVKEEKKDKPKKSKWNDISLIYCYPDYIEEINGHTGIKHGCSVKKIKISSLSALSSTLLYHDLEQNENNYQYTAIKQRIKILFGEWIDKTKAPSSIVPSVFLT